MIRRFDCSKSSFFPSPDSSQSETTEGSFQRLEAPSYLDYRAEAFQYYKLRDECFKKAALAFSNKQGQLAQYYARQVQEHVCLSFWALLKLIKTRFGELVEPAILIRGVA